MTQLQAFPTNAGKELAARIFAKILYKTNLSTKKGNQKQIGIDLLKTSLQKDLLAISTLKIEETYTKILEKNDPKAFMKKTG